MIEPSYSEPVQQLFKLGEPQSGRWPDYSAMGITPADIPELIYLIEDESMRWEEVSDDEYDLPEWYAQVHAWRALGQLKAEGAIPALIGILRQVDDYDDDWTGEELRDVFAMIGPAAIAPLAAYLANPENQTYARGAAAGSLAQIAKDNPDARENCVAALVKALESFEQNNETINAFIIIELVRLKAVEHIALIEQAFQADKVDEWVGGDFEDIQVNLGLLTKRNTPARNAGFMPEPLAGARAASHKSTKKEKAKRKQEKLSRKKNRKKKKK